MVKRILSFLMELLTSSPSYPKTLLLSKKLKIADGKLTVTDDGFERTFDLTAGVDDALAAELGRIGVSKADLEALIHLSQHRGVRVPTIRFQQQNTTAAFSIMARSSPTYTSKLTVKVNGQERTYDTRSGISEELLKQLADEMGVTPAEVITLLKIPLELVRNPQAGKEMLLSTNSEAEAAICPRCGFRGLAGKHCQYCGELLTSAKSAATGNPQT